ncbi:MAG: hypothetical protein Athens101426_359 [Parcubacteria group bacterium Athens1014_26]|nr:MAG: hypothetical protein Athens101426_359 [Parcubacteria group bacterium Athens1014_26]
MKDYYKILGIEKNATPEKIKEAYRKLAHKYHPDKSGGDEKKFKEINEAYQTLSDQNKRAQYDRFGNAYGGGNNYGGQNPFSDFGFSAGGGSAFDGDFNFSQNGVNFDNFSDLGDIFETFFGGFGGGKRRAYQRGADLEIIQEITLEDAFIGITKKINFETFAVCKKCGGAGYFEKESFTPCSNCGGKGEIREIRKSFFGNLSQIKTCPKCSGEGRIPNKICGDCHSKGRIKEIKNIEAYIAPGTADGQIIKISGAGETGEKNSGAGDLYVRIKIKPHSYFIRNGNDLVIKKELGLINILLGKKVEVTTISGNKVGVEIPENFNLREKLRISGEGMPKLGSFGRGDLYIEFQIRTPKKLNNKIKKTLEDLNDNDYL